MRLVWTRLPKRDGIQRLGLVRSRFTLVELLVVVTIVAILAGLLLPSLLGALSAARKTMCLNQLRQAGQETVAYSENFNGRVPLYCMWSNKVQSNVVWGVNGAGTSTLAGFTALGKMYYAGLMRTPQIYYCPNETRTLYNNRAGSGIYNTPWPPGRWMESSQTPPNGASGAGETSRIAYGTRPVAGEMQAGANWQLFEASSPPRIQKYGNKMIWTELIRGTPVSLRHVDGMNALRGDCSGRWVSLDVYFVNLASGTNLDTGEQTNGEKILTVNSTTGKDTGVWGDLDRAP